MTSDVTIDIHINTRPRNRHSSSELFCVSGSFTFSAGVVMVPDITFWIRRNQHEASAQYSSNRRSVLHNLGAYTTVNKENAYYFPLFFYLKVVNEAEQGGSWRRFVNQYVCQISRRFRRHHVLTVAVNIGAGPSR